MRNAFVFELLDKHLGDFLETIEKCPVDKRLVVPEGFKNSVHWQLGHVLTATEFHVYALSEQALSLPANYEALFAYGTKPADWKEELPAWDLLVSQLKEQNKRIYEQLKDKLETPVNENFLKAQTIGELILNTVIHLGYHVGVNSIMLKTLNNQ